MLAVKLSDVLLEQGDSYIPFFVIMSGEIEIVRPSGAIETLLPYMAQVSLQARSICCVDVVLSFVHE